MTNEIRRWVSVKKKKPKINQLVIVCAKSLSPTYGWRNDSTTWIVADEPHYANSKLDRISFVEYWMPLPEPYREVEGGEK